MFSPPFSIPIGSRDALGGLTMVGDNLAHGDDIISSALKAAVTE